MISKTIVLCVTNSTLILLIIIIHGLLIDCDFGAIFSVYLFELRFDHYKSKLFVTSNLDIFLL